MKRGAKNKPADLHVVDGTFRKHRHEAPDGAPEPTGRPIRPSFVKGRAAKILAEYVERAFWLSSVESHLLGIVRLTGRDLADQNRS